MIRPVIIFIIVFAVIAVVRNKKDFKSPKFLLSTAGITIIIAIFIFIVSLLLSQLVNVRNLPRKDISREEFEKITNTEVITVSGDLDRRIIKEQDTGEFYYMINGKKIRIDLPEGDIGGGYKNIVDDGSFFGVIYEFCGAALIQKYDYDGNKIYNIFTGDHSHSTGVLDIRNNRLFLYHFEWNFLGHSIVEYDWRTGKRRGLIRVRAKNPDLFAIDSEGKKIFIGDKGDVIEQILI